MESDGASFLSRTKLKRDHVCTRSLRPVVMAAERFFLHISVISFPSSLEIEGKSGSQPEQEAVTTVYSYGF